MHKSLSGKYVQIKKASKNYVLKALIAVVGATGFEPVTLCL